MKIFLDCIPCLVRQTVDYLLRTTDDPGLQERLLKGVLRIIGEMDLKSSPPVMTQAIHRFIREQTLAEDPYRAEKDEFNRFALRLYPRLKSEIQTSTDPLETAVRLAIAGNIIDLGANSRLRETDINVAIEGALDQPLVGNVTLFRDIISKAKTILYLTDNAGEIVFDRLLIEELPAEKVTVGVRGSPTLNDATLRDAVTAGLTELVGVIDNGSDAPGTVLEDCSEEFRHYFEKADLVIAKGQGNYETLSEVEKDIFFLLKVKCPVVSEDLGCGLGSLVLGRSACKKA